MAASLSIYLKTNFAERFNTFGARHHRATGSRSNLYQLHLIFRQWLPALTQHFFVEVDRLANVNQGFISSLALTNAPRKTWDLSYNKTILAGIQ